MVGAVGFEPTTFWSQTRRATKLRYAPPIRLHYDTVKRGRKVKQEKVWPPFLAVIVRAKHSWSEYLPLSDTKSCGIRSNPKRQRTARTPRRFARMLTDSFSHPDHWFGLDEELLSAICLLRRLFVFVRDENCVFSPKDLKPSARR